MTVQRVEIQNGKVVSTSGELSLTPMKVIGANTNGNNTSTDNPGNNVQSKPANSTQNNGQTGNNTKLPQTGEEENVFATWLIRATILVAVWLGSMLVIDCEKRKMANK